MRLGEAFRRTCQTPGGGGGGGGGSWRQSCHPSALFNVEKEYETPKKCKIITSILTLDDRFSTIYIHI